jgi:hypothetical protein
MTTQIEGRDQAMKLAFALFLEDISYSGFAKLSMQDQLNFAEGNAGLNGAEDLIAALRCYSQLMAARVVAFERSLEAQRAQTGGLAH